MHYLQGHGDVLSLDFSSSDSVKWPDLDDEFAEESSSSKTLPALLNRFGLRKGSKGTGTEGWLLNFFPRICTVIGLY